MGGIVADSAQTRVGNNSETAAKEDGNMTIRGVNRIESRLCQIAGGIDGIPPLKRMINGLRPT